ncbi:MAG: AAA family ATPase, partial [Saprospiraceae bacterium]
MIIRNLYKRLLEWRSSINRKPLILRGARQTGKTTLINDFGKEYDQYLYFNLEKEADKNIFAPLPDLNKCINVMFLSRDKVLQNDLSTLVFIDEVQELPPILEQLRYFYEEWPQLHIIVAGSLLEFALEKIERTPVGRVEFMELHPINFKEYLQALPQQAALKAMTEIPVKNEALPILFSLFHDFVLIGGMPEIVSLYIQNKNVPLLLKSYAAILESYKSDVEKYARNTNQKLIIRHVIDTAPYETDKRVTLNKFGASSFNSKDIKEAISTLEKAKYLELMYPTTHALPPASPDYKKRPRLHLLDIGLYNFQLGLHRELL